jgi:hypothetical protein
LKKPVLEKRIRIVICITFLSGKNNFSCQSVLLMMFCVLKMILQFSLGLNNPNISFSVSYFQIFSVLMLSVGLMHTI